MPNHPRTPAARHAAALCLIAHALGGCTTSVAEPIYIAYAAAGHHAAGTGHAGMSGNAGAAGNSGNSDAGTKGDAGAGKSICEFPGTATTRSLDEDDMALLVLLNDSIQHHADCPDHDHPLSRPQFATHGNDLLNCSSRYRATADYSGISLAKPPGTPGPSHDPFAPSMDSDNTLEVKATMPDLARDAFLNDAQACMKLQMAKYTSIGVGHAGNVWVITLSE